MHFLANPYTRKLFKLTGLLSVGAEGQVQLAVQWLHHSYKYLNEANETPHRHTLERNVSLTDHRSYISYSIYYGIFELKANCMPFLNNSKQAAACQNVLRRASSISAHVMDA